MRRKNVYVLKLCIKFDSGCRYNKIFNFQPSVYHFVPKLNDRI